MYFVPPELRCQDTDLSVPKSNTFRTDEVQIQKGVEDPHQHKMGTKNPNMERRSPIIEIEAEKLLDIRLKSVYFKKKLATISASLSKESKD